VAVAVGAHQGKVCLLDAQILDQLDEAVNVHQILVVLT
jgi:hypothetical protein